MACGENTTLNQLVDSIKINLSNSYRNNIKDIKVNYGPERKGDVKHSLADIDKAKRLLSYNPEVSFEKGIQKTIHWFLNS